MEAGILLELLLKAVVQCYVLVSRAIVVKDVVEGVVAEW